MSNGYIANFMGGSPASVLIRLLVVSLIVGLLLSMFGFEPENVYEAIVRSFRRLWEFGLGDIRRVGRILLTGALVVFPVWLVLRLFGARRSRS